MAIAFLAADGFSVQTERFYGRRSGKKLRPNRTRLVEELLPKLLLCHSGESRNPLETANAGEWRDIWLEIGFGAGEHLAWQAAQKPDVLMIGCEPYINGVAKLLDYIDEQKLKNIRIHPDDARPLLDALPEKSLGRVFILFNDPWPKKRHWERRFVNPENLARLARVMKPGAELRLATDHPGLLEWVLQHMQACPDFVWQAESCRDWQSRPSDWPPTRYEQKALHGKPVYLRYLRI
jgi:tRNA (guanine-N7-)-methyltransferase